ncbi:RNA polymerase sigma-70 factor, ECF subfamily [Thermosulfidibacter takaii ABI70S6]|uniref:RNA polymerase sigma-70 factor, ECF subfamily n=2 Tax=Thermosulfidibacter takaii TaxID=412593 RepID=A0A0S3QTA2_THET7|nr:RNA polymerase sigma-70 factor, ECF subfamily [Thermosulfidibacter takaii ABI70S6]
MRDERLYALIKAVAEGSEVAFICLYDEVWQKVYSFVFSILQNESISEDIVAETFLEIWKNASNFKGKADPLTWILGIARNKCLKELRRTSKRGMEPLENLPEPSMDISPQQNNLFAKDFIQNVLAKLSPIHREVLNLVFYQGLSYSEIAELLDVPVNTVKTRVFYAKQRLKEILQQMGVSERDL